MTVNPNLETSRNTHIMYKTLHHSKNSLILHESGAVPPQIQLEILDWGCKYPFAHFQGGG